MSNQGRIDALTGLRCLAALSIFVWHLRGYFVPNNFYQPFNPAGAVPLFFVLSGFVLSVGGMRGRSWLDFFVARFARIWPAHMAAIALLFALMWPWSLSYFRTAESVSSLVLNVTLIHDWLPETFGDYNGVSWSISAEMFFYAAFPFLLAPMAKWPLRTLAIYTIVAIGWVIGVAVLAPQYGPMWGSTMNPVVGLWAFLFGVLAGTRYQQVVQFVRNVQKWAVIEACVIAIALVANACYLMPLFGQESIDNFLKGIGPAPYYALLVLALAVSRGPVARFLSTRPMVYMGEVSFAFYLVHQIVIRWYGDHIALFNQPAPVRIVFLFGASSAAAMLIFHLIEKPSRAAIVNAWKQRRLVGTTAANETVGGNRA